MSHFILTFKYVEITEKEKKNVLDQSCGTLWEISLGTD